MAWDVIITKSIDQTVTNNATPQADTQLFTPLVANGLYEVEFSLLSSGNATAGDYQGRFTIPTIAAGTSVGWVCHYNASVALTFVSFTNGAGQMPAANIQFAGLASNAPLTSIIKFLLKNEGNAGNLQWEFSNLAADVGRTSTTYAGSTLKVKRWV